MLGSLGSTFLAKSMPRALSYYLNHLATKLQPLGLPSTGPQLLGEKHRQLGDLTGWGQAVKTEGKEINSESTRLGAPVWAQLVPRPTSAQVTISWFMSLSPTSGSVLTAQSLDPASDSVSPSLSAPPHLMLCPSVSLSVSQKQINIKKKKRINQVSPGHTYKAISRGPRSSTKGLGPGEEGSGQEAKPWGLHG